MLDWGGRRTAFAVAVVVSTFAAFPAQADDTPLRDAAVQQVRTEVAYIQHVLASSGRHEPVEYLEALAAMSYVQGHVSAPEYGYLRDIAHSALPGADSESILATSAGICGNAEWLFTDILHQFGVKTRPVQFFYSQDDGSEGGHIAAEVFYQRAWHYFDPTWGAFFRAPKAAPALVLPVADVLKLPRPRAYLVANRTLMWTQVVNEMGWGKYTGMTAIFLRAKRVVVDGRPLSG
jgi:hypothetical protein